MAYFSPSTKFSSSAFAAKHTHSMSTFCSNNVNNKTALNRVQTTDKARWPKFPDLVCDVDLEVWNQTLIRFKSLVPLFQKISSCPDPGTLDSDHDMDHHLNVTDYQATPHPSRKFQQNPFKTSRQILQNVSLCPISLWQRILENYQGSMNESGSSPKPKQFLPST